VKAGLEQLGASVPPTTPEERDALERYDTMLQAWNERSGLVSPKTLATALVTHFVDSLFLADVVGRFRGSFPVVDLGSGGGFPGLVIALRHRTVPVDCYERTEKKRAFLAAVQEALGLGNVRIHGDFTGKHPAALYIARAMMPRDELLKLLRRTTPPGTRVLTCLGGSKPLPAPAPGYRRLDVVRYQLPLDAGPRVVEIHDRVDGPAGGVSRGTG
jgi:16S rRNA (guanine(527)-N(7))-methyltransferase RsmG